MATILYTSLAEIKSFNPCISGWEAILNGQNKKEVDNVLFPLIDCLNSNSIDDVCWLLRKRKKEINIAVKFARKCADSVKHLNTEYAADATYAAEYTTVYTAYAVEYAIDAAIAAECATAAAYVAKHADAGAANIARTKQKQLHKQFLIECIKEWEEAH